MQDRADETARDLWADVRKNGADREDIERRIAAALRAGREAAIGECARKADEHACSGCRAYGEFGRAIRTLTEAGRGD